MKRKHGWRNCGWSWKVGNLGRKWTHPVNCVMVCLALGLLLFVEMKWEMVRARERERSFYSWKQWYTMCLCAPTCSTNAKLFSMLASYHQISPQLPTNDSKSHEGKLLGLLLVSGWYFTIKSKHSMCSNNNSSFILNSNVHFCIQTASSNQWTTLRKFLSEGNFFKK